MPVVPDDSELGAALRTRSRVSSGVSSARSSFHHPNGHGRRSKACWFLLTPLVRGKRVTRSK